VFAWTSLGHECGGHDVFGSDDVMLNQITDNVRKALENDGFDEEIVSYWSNIDRLNETGADLMGILNMGPAAGIGVITFFRSSFVKNNNLLRVTLSLSDPHPNDILRAYLAADMIRDILNYDYEDQRFWGDLIEQQGNLDLAKQGGRIIKVKRDPNNPGHVMKAGYIDLDAYRRSVKVVVRAIVATPLTDLHNLHLSEIVTWTYDDWQLSNSFIQLVKEGTDTPLGKEDVQFNAAHVVSAAALFCLSEDGKGKLDDAFKWMVKNLDGLYKLNPKWANPNIPKSYMHPSKFFKANRVLLEE